MSLRFDYQVDVRIGDFQQVVELNFQRNVAPTHPTVYRAEREKFWGAVQKA